MTEKVSVLPRKSHRNKGHKVMLFKHYLVNTKVWSCVFKPLKKLSNH